MKFEVAIPVTYQASGSYFSGGYADISVNSDGAVNIKCNGQEVSIEYRRLATILRTWKELSK